MNRVGRWLIILLFLTGTLWAATSGDYYTAGIQLYQQRQYAKSIQYFRAATQLDPQNWKAYQVMGQAYYQLGDRTDAVQMMDLSLRINPSNQPLRQFRNNLAATTSGGNGNSDNPAVKGGGPFGLGLEIGTPAPGEFLESFGWTATARFSLRSKSAPERFYNWIICCMITMSFIPKAV